VRLHPRETTSSKPHTEPEELPIVFDTQRKKDELYFNLVDSEKTCYFEIRIENGKNEYGPWRPMFYAIVP
jgi:hypothetical protein